MTSKQRMPITFPVILCALLGCGLMAGLFFAFSVAVMRALANLSPERGIAAMQAINIAILNPVFLTVFMGTSALCAYLLLASLLTGRTASSPYLLAGSLLYLLGVLLVTVTVNVPLNNTLAPLTPDNPDSIAVWNTYLSRWTAWNHVRTVAATLATALFAVALYQSAHRP